MSTRPTINRRWWREPLVHFLVIGALLFLAFHWGAPTGPGSNRIVITPGQVEALGTAFARTWQRPPTEQELKGQLDEYIREEVATREAMAMGLDREDTIIRRRLRQKLEFLAEDTIETAPPTERQLQAWLDAHPDSYRVEPEVSFRQVYLNPERRKTALEADTRSLREQLAAAPPTAGIDTLGDSVMLPQEVGRSSRSDVARQFGEEFASGILTLEAGRWTGPVRSGYGVHLVFVREHHEGRLPTLAEVRPQVERDFTTDRRKKQLDAMYDRLLERYRIVVERRSVAPPEAGATAGGGR